MLLAQGSDHLLCLVIVFQVGNDCMVDESVSVGEKVSIKKSVIGKHTTIGEKVKISNSVIMDHVTITEGYVF